MPAINGVLVGVVVDTRDPMQQRRIRVRLPSIDHQTSEWARVAIGSGRVRSTVPDVDDEVLVAFEHGDVRRRSSSVRSGMARSGHPSHGR